MLTSNIAADFTAGVAVGLFLGFVLYGIIISLIKKFSKAEDKDSD
jgi:F0F1-type ATP synthase assembly protein I